MRKVVAAALLALVLAASLTVWASSITHSYSWEYGNRRWSLTHTFPLAAYTRARELPHTVNYADYANYVHDPVDDEAISSLIEELEALAFQAGLNVWEKLNLIMAFVQSLEYEAEAREYPKYPIETLVEGRGDCEDFSILAAALLKQMGFGVVLLAFTEEMHMAIGIRVLPPGEEDSHCYLWNGDAYYYLETTASGWAIGTLPSNYTSSPKIIAVAPVGP